VSKIFTVFESALSQSDCDVSDLAVIVIGEGEVFTNVGPEFRSQIMINIVIGIGEILTIGESDIRIGSFLSPSVSEIDEMPSDV
jgi:hypothetical protein